MEVEKRKRQGNGEPSCKRGKPHDDAVAPAAALPRDEEVDEFFAILKRIQVAVTYFKGRNGVGWTDGDSTAKPPWRPSFKKEDFDGVKKERESSGESRKVGLDLNSDPASDVSDSV